MARRSRIVQSAVALLGMGTAPAAVADITFADFSDVSALSLVGSATQTGVALRLTSAAGGEAGAAYFAQKQFLADGFTTTFDFVLPSVPTSGDGFAFIIQDASLTELGDGGSGMGYAFNGGSGITRSLAVEFDTFSFFGEFPATHVSIQSNGVNENQSLDAFSLGHAMPVAPIDDGATHTATISYIAGILCVELDGAFLFSAPVDLGDLGGQSILDAEGKAWVGFTAGTGLAATPHTIESWSFVEGIPTCTAPQVAPPDPFNADVNVGDDLELTTAITAGSTPLLIQWYKDDQPLIDDGVHYFGVHALALRIVNIQPEHAGAYGVGIGNPCGGYGIGPAIVTVVDPGACDGDVNCDFALDGFDVEVQEKAVGGDSSDYCQSDPDFNRDFALDGFDVEAVELVVGGGPCP